MNVFISVVALLFIALVYFFYREIKNAPLQCGRCNYLIPACLGDKCPNCGYDNDSYRNQIKNAPLACDRCRHLILNHLDNKCPNCGYNND